MRQGRPIGTRFREVALLAAPLAFSAFSLAFAALVEQLVLKRHSPAAAGASLTGGTLAGTFAVLITATASYATVFVAQFHGAGKGARAAAFFAQGVWIAALSLPLFAAAVPVGRFFLGHVGHAPELLAAETTFFSISVFGGFFTTLAAALSCLFLGQGRSMPVFLTNSSDASSRRRSCRSPSSAEGRFRRSASPAPRESASSPRSRSAWRSFPSSRATDSSAAISPR